MTASEQASQITDEGTWKAEPPTTTVSQGQWIWFVLEADEF